MGKLLYFDNAATTRMDPQVVEVMMKYLTEEYGNASAQYSIGFNAKRAINRAREYAAVLINAEMDEITFTSGGTEADNHALQYVRSFERGKSIVTTAIEHPAVLNTCKKLEREGYVVRYVKPDNNGFCSPESIERAIDGSTVMVSVMMANNEVGTIEPIEEIASIAHKHGCVFHTDAVQCFGIEDIDVKKMHIDILSASSHKLYGPKGVGLIYIKRGLTIPHFIEGGGQEYAVRSGTENVAAIAAFGEACRMAKEELHERRKSESLLRDYIAKRVLEEIPDSYINGVGIDNNSADEKRLSNNIKRLPGNLHLSFRGVNGNSLRVLLDMKNICVSTGSACSASNQKPSHVLEAMELESSLIDSSLRITIGKYNTKEEADELIEVLKASVSSIRRLTNYKGNI